MRHLSSAMGATALATALSLALSTSASAQVATLVGPEDTPAPQMVEAAPLGPADREDALLAFAQCMRDNGADMDDPQVGDRGRGGFIRGEGPRALDELDETWLSAQQACSPILEAARPELDPAAEQERLEQQLALASCLRERGFPDYPDPSVDDGGRLQRGGGGLLELDIDPRSEEFQAARLACADALGFEDVGPGLRPGPGRFEGSDG